MGPYRLDGDTLTLDMHPGQLQAWDSERRTVAIVAGTQSGKALALDTEIPTPCGFVRMGDIATGDTVFDRDGNPCRVLFAHPVMMARRCYRVHFDDGNSIVADAEHLWITRTRSQRKNMARRVARPNSSHADRPQCRPTPDESVCDTDAIRRTLHSHDGCSNHSIDNCKPVHFQSSPSNLPIPPYTLGAWLGDGHSSSSVLTSADPEILAAIKADGIKVGPPRENHSGAARGYSLGTSLPRVRWDESRKARVITLYHAGKNLAEIAEEVGGGRQAVRRVLRQAGIQIERRPSRIGHRKRSDTGTFLSGKLTRQKLADPNLSLQAILRREWLLGNKHIPAAYMRASFEQRLSLLQGLMDTDGSCDGSCEFSNSNALLANQVLELACSLGIKAKLASKTATLNGRDCGLAYRVTFTTDLPVFRLTRKAARMTRSARPDTGRRFIVSIEEVDSVPVRCITVDSPSETYLCTRSFIPTHNTVFLPLWLWREITLRGAGDYGFISPTFTLMELKALPEFKRLFEETLRLGEYVGSPVRKFTVSEDGEIFLFGARQTVPTHVYFGYAENPDSLESSTYKAVVADEAGQKAFRRESYEALRRRLAIHEGRLCIATTPYMATGWLKTEIFDRYKAGDPSVDLIQFTSLMNPVFPRDEYNWAQANLPPWRFALFYKGELSKPAGAIYDCFDPQKHTCPRFAIPADWPRWIGLDFGSVNTAAVFLAEEKVMRSGSYVSTGRYFVYKTYGPFGSKTSAQHAAALIAGEPRRPTAIGGSHQEAGWREAFASGGLAVQEPPVPDVEVGIDRVYAAIVSGNLTVFSDLHALLDDIGAYSREVDDMGTISDKIEDKSAWHRLDALRYVCTRLFGGPTFRVQRLL